MADRYRGGWSDWADPFHELRRLQGEVNRALSRRPSAETDGYPAVNLWVGEHDAVVTAPIPGADVGSLEVSVHQTTLTIKGRAEGGPEEEGASYHRRERRRGSFARSIALPFEVDAEKVQADYARGILSIYLPRPEHKKPRRIEISRH